MNKESLTQARLKELLHYNPETGVFTWKEGRGGVNIGDIAGSVTRYSYLSICVDTVKYQSHRLAFLYMDGGFPSDQVDHINHARADNRWDNLREVTRLINSKNVSIGSRNTSGTMGVWWDNNREKWSAEIKANGRKVFLGRFSNKIDAVIVRKRAELKYGFHPNHGVEVV